MAMLTEDDLVDEWEAALEKVALYLTDYDRDSLVDAMEEAIIASRALTLFEKERNKGLRIIRFSMDDLEGVCHG